jgi:ABC-type Na+ efflux pump permease subunit
MDMTVGEKERKTLEAFLVLPVRREIVFGKTLAAITSILVTAAADLIRHGLFA